MQIFIFFSFVFCYTNLFGCVIYYLDEDEWWENQITGRDVLRDKGAEKLEVLDMSEDHFSLPEVRIYYL